MGEVPKKIVETVVSFAVINYNSGILGFGYVFDSMGVSRGYYLRKLHQIKT